MYQQLEHKTHTHQICERVSSPSNSLSLSDMNPYIKPHCFRFFLVADEPPNCASAHPLAEQMCCLFGRFRSQALDSHSSLLLHRELTRPSTERNTVGQSIHNTFHLMLEGRFWEIRCLANRSISNILPFNVTL